MMTPSQLLETIAQSGLVDPKTIAKLQRELDNPKKHIKAKAIIKVLVDRGELTVAQGEKFLTGQWKTATDTKAKPVYDTNNLMDLGPDPKPAGKAKGKQEEIVEVEYDAEGTHVYDVDEALSPQDMQVPVDVQPTGAYDPFHDEQAFGGNASLGQGLAQDGKSQFAQPTLNELSFAGKRERVDQWKTKWLFIGSGLLFIIMIVGVLLLMFVFQTEPEELFKNAEQSYTSGAYIDAMAKFKDFHTRFPKNDKASQARVREVQCLIWEPFQAKNFNEVYNIAMNKVATIEDEPAVEFIKDDYSVWFPDTALAFSEEALKQTTIDAMTKSLDKAREAGQVLDFLTANQKKSERVAPMIEKYANNLKTVEGMINKEKAYEAALVAIADHSSKSETDQAFSLFSTLTRTYGDLGARLPLREAMKKVTESEINLVKPSDIVIETSSTDSTVAFDQQITMASKRGTKTTTIQDELIPFLVEGYVYVVSGSDGDVLWSRFVGFESLIKPVWVDANSRKELIVVDQRTNDLMRLDAKNGKLIWRARVGEPFLEPSIHNQSVYVSTRSGSVIRLDLQTGEKICATKLPRKIGLPVTPADQDPYIYVVAVDSNVYILSSEDLHCHEVFYLGHNANEIRIAPIYWTGYLLVAINGEGSELHVLRLANKGLGMERLQIIRLAKGSMSLPPTRLGRNMLFVSDEGDLKLIEMTTSEEKTPVALTAEEKFDSRGASRVFVLAQGTGLWIASKGLTSFSVDKVKGQFARQDILLASDTFLAPMLRIDDVLIHVRRRDGSRQISVSAVSVPELKELWRSDFGAPPASAPMAIGDKLYGVSSQGDLFDLTSAKPGNDCLRQLQTASDIDSPFNFTTMVKVDEQSYAALDQDVPDMLTVDFSQNKSRLVRLQPPSDKFASSPVALSTDFLFPALAGQIFRMDANGRGVGSPFQPPLQGGETVNWNRPAVNRSDAIIVGDEKQNVFLLDAQKRGSLTQVGVLKLDGLIASPFVGNDEFGFGFAEGNGKVELLKIPFTTPFALAGKVAAPARVVAGPFLVGDKVLAHLDDGRLYSWDLNLVPLWNLEVSNDRIANVLSMDGSNQMLVAFETGKLMRVDASGQAQAPMDLGQPIRHGPLFVGDKAYFTTGNGTVLVIDRSKF